MRSFNSLLRDQRYLTPMDLEYFYTFQFSLARSVVGFFFLFHLFHSLSILSCEIRHNLYNIGGGWIWLLSILSCEISRDYHEFT